MRKVIWTDKNGRRHASLIRDGDPDEAAPGGLSGDPPALDNLDWEAAKQDIHNGLVDLGADTWHSLQHRMTDVTALVLNAVRKRIVLLYRQHEQGEVGNDG